MVNFILGLMVGGFFGVAIMCVFQAGRSDRD